jgi:hypothetical protein
VPLKVHADRFPCRRVTNPRRVSTSAQAKWILLFNRQSRRAMWDSVDSELQ